MSKALIKLINVKTMVSLVLTGVFAYLACTQHIQSEQFLTIFTVVISFYFGTQLNKPTNEGDGK